MVDVTSFRGRHSRVATIFDRVESTKMAVIIYYILIIDCPSVSLYLLDCGVPKMS